MFLALPLLADMPRPVNVYVDADFSRHPAVAEAITLGLRAALHGVGNRIGGHPVEIVTRDHRSSPRRSLETMRIVARDPNALAVFGGKESPPYLSFGHQINESQVPLLLSWSAAGPVTRLADGAANYVFRVSVDDSKAGPFLIGQALDAGCKRIALLLLDSGWGRSNRATMQAALRDQGQFPIHVAAVPSDLGASAAQKLASEVAVSGSDCAVAALSAATSGVLLSALAELPEPPRVISHWGILGGHVEEHLPDAFARRLDLKVLHTCVTASDTPENPVLQRALTAARSLAPSVRGLADIEASAGFVHSYDLAQIMIAAASQAEGDPRWAEGGQSRRVALHHALQNLRGAVPGILKSYYRPFTPVSAEAPDGHEALGLRDLCMTRYAPEGRPVAWVPAN